MTGTIKPDPIVIASSKDWYQDLPKALKEELGIEVYYVADKIDLTVEKMIALSPAFIFFPHWSHKIPPEIFTRFECVIFHMTDLPFGRGGSPLQNLIARSIYETKLTALKCVEEIDAGPIYLKRDLSLRQGSALDVFNYCAKLMTSMIVEIYNLRPLPSPQTGEVVHFKRRTPEDSAIGLPRSAQELHDFIRMLDCPGYPSAFLNAGNLQIELTSSELRDGEIFATARIKVKNERK